MWDGNGKGLKLYQQRARADWAARVNLYAEIADGKLEQRVVTDSEKGGRSVITYTPSAKDRMAALDKLAQYGQVPVAGKGGGGGGVDLPSLIRALSAVMSDPVTRRNLLQDNRVADTLKLLAAEPVELEGDGTASGMPGDDEASDDASES